MFDIHLPHKSIHGLQEFFLHLFTITVGLLIAVQIESCVEWRHHVHLADEARASLRAEIEQNLKELKQAQIGLKAWRASNDTDLAAMRRIQEHPDDPDAQHANLEVNASGITLEDTAWRTAQSTGALAYMPYEEAERYSNIYQAQTALIAMEDKPLEDAAQILGLIEKLNFHSSRSHKITASEAGELAEKFGRMRLHLANGDTLLQASIEQSEAFLENRKARQNFQETLP
jgi:hypothetical protein